MFLSSLGGEDVNVNIWIWKLYFSISSRGCVAKTMQRNDVIGPCNCDSFSWTFKCVRAAGFTKRYNIRSGQRSTEHEEILPI